MWHLSFHMNDGRMTRTILETCVRDSRGMFQCEITERIQARRPQKWNCGGIHSEGYGGMQHWEITLGCYSQRRQWETTDRRSCRFWKLGSMYPERYNGKRRWEATVGGQDRLHCRL